MTTAFVSTLAAATELLQLVADLALLCLGLQVARTVLDTLDRLVAALRWVAGLLQLLLVLVCTATAEFAPVAGRYAGRAAGTAVRLGRQARRWYGQHAAHHAAAADRAGRRFVAQQLGTGYPAIREAIEPAAPVLVRPVVAKALPGLLPSLPRRQLLTLAKDRQVARYSRLSTADLREALAATC